MNATIILNNGNRISLSEWQKMYCLQLGSNKIGRHFYIGERSFKNDLEVAEPLIRILDVIRVIRGKSVHLNSLDRTNEEQKELTRRGYRTAKFSPHVEKMGADIDTVTREDTYDLVECIEDAAEILGYEVRIGYEKYLNDGNTFVHLDVTPMFFAPDRIFYEKSHPKQWESQLRW